MGYRTRRYNTGRQPDYNDHNNNYNYYTENRWGEAKNFDLCLNATLGRDACADLIVAAAKAMQAANK